MSRHNLLSALTGAVLVNPAAAKAPPDAGESAPVSANVPSYAALLNRKLVVPQVDPSFLLVERHLLTRMMSALLDSIHVDEVWYCSRYKDVAETIERGGFESGKAHYVKFGYFEHRMPYPIEINEEWYLSAYPDVRAAVDREDFESGQEHFEQVGYAEGRLPYSSFELRKG